MLFRSFCVLVLITTNFVFAAEEKNTLGSVVPVAPQVFNNEASDIETVGFNEFFKMPVGRFGLEMTDKLKGLDGKKVRLRGFMVKEDRCRGGHAHNPADADKEVVKGRFMLSPAPVMISYACFGTSDDLFPQTVFVRIPELANKPVPYSSTPLELIGTLSVGPSQEPDDRISQVRLVLDPLPVSVISQLESASAPTSQNHKGCDDSSHSH